MLIVNIKRRIRPMPVLALTGLVLFFTPAVWHLVGIWLTSSAHHHGLLALPLTFWLLHRDGAFASSQRAPTLCLPLVAGLCGAVGLTAVGYLTDLKIAQHLGVYLALVTALAIYFGAPGLRRHGAALAFLGFMVPAGDLLIPPLQGLTTEAILLFGRWVDLALTRDGFLLTSDAGRFVVAEACAGLRFLMAALMLATFYGLACRFPATRMAVFIGLATILALAANGLRAFSMVWLATISDMQWGVGLDHYYFGWLIYLAMFFALYGLGTRLRPANPRAI